MFTQKQLDSVSPEVKAVLEELDAEEEASNVQFEGFVDLDERITSCDAELAPSVIVSKRGIVLILQSQRSYTFSNPVVQGTKERVPYQLAKEDESCFCHEHFFDHVDVN